MAFVIRSAIKYVLFMLNILLTICGIVALSIAAFLKTRGVPDWLAETWSKYTTVAIILGCIVAVVAIVGCIGSILENKIMLTIYSASIVILTIVQTILIVVVFMMRHSIHAKIPIVYELLIKNNETVQYYLYIFELIIAGLAMLAVFFQFMAAVASCFLGHYRRSSKLIQVE